MGTRDPRVDAYLQKAAPFAQPILAHLRALIHKALPKVRETIKWGMPHYEQSGIVCHTASFKAHVGVGFRQQDQMTASAAIFKSDGNAMSGLGRITSLKDLPADKALIAAFREAAALNEKGVKPSRPTKPPPRVPAALKKALEANPAARERFENFSPSHKREYVDWIVEAKSEATRDRRIATAVEWIAQSKPRNWKYDRASSA